MMEGAMQTRDEALGGYAAALNASSWENLQESYPIIADTLAAAVGAGNTPGHIYSITIRSGHSPSLARWCRAAATHLKRGGE